MMDNDMRFRIAQEVDDSKFKHDVQSLLKIGKQITKKTPSVFVTDGLPAYNDIFKKEYAPKNFLRKPSKHVKDIYFKNQVANNNIQERLNGEFRDREKIFRELKKMIRLQYMASSYITTTSDPHEPERRYIRRQDRNPNQQ